MTDETNALIVEALSAGYRKRTVLHGVSLPPIRPGMVVALVGPNGAGKSTLLRALAGLIPATGSIRFAGTNLVGLSLTRRARHIAFMPQALPQGIGLNVMEGVIAALRATPADLATDETSFSAIAGSALERLGIADLALEPLDWLSGGQRQLAALAQALVREPGILLLDEPTSALDPNHQFQVMRIIRELADERRIVIGVFHDLNIAARWADLVVMLAGGRVEAAAPPAEALTAANLDRVYKVSARAEVCSRGVLQIIVDGVNS